ncbi:MAG: hypothetical protein ACOCX4_07010, partial [Planctomycetota bacterium]
MPDGNLISQQGGQRQPLDARTAGGGPVSASGPMPAFEAGTELHGRVVADRGGGRYMVEFPPAEDARIPAGGEAAPAADADAAPARMVLE